jgi:predicted acylesterase/phospholipase RssA
MIKLFYILIIESDMRLTLLTYFVSLFHVTFSECNILSLSGGGSFGAVEAGILDGLVSSEQIPSQFDVITGISAGGLNAGFLYHFQNVTSAIPKLQELYSTTKTADIYESDIFGIFSRWSIYNNKPLENTLNQVLGHTNQTANPPIVLIGASNVLTEQLDVFSFHDLSFQEKVDVLMSTTAIPFIFPPRTFRNGLYVDGGVISNEMITQAIGEVQCNFYNITFISASTRDKNTNKVDGLFSYLSAVVRMIFRTFDNQLAQVSSCTYPKGQITACFPTSEELNSYSIFDFDHGSQLYELGKQNNECEVFQLC